MLSTVDADIMYTSAWPGGHVDRGFGGARQEEWRSTWSDGF